jgi:uncharacterized protein (TIGR01244 family)
MQNVTHLTPAFAVSPQITATQVAQLKDEGFTTLICNRPDHEEPGQPTFAEISAAARAAGLQTHHIPFKPGQATAQDAQAFSAVLTGAPGKVLAYCRSGGRAQNLFVATQG